LSKAEQIAQRCVDIGASACALTDHGSVSGAVQFSNKMRKAGLKPILGCEMYVARNLRRGEDYIEIDGLKRRQAYHSHLIVLAKNYKGWLDLIQLVSESNNPDYFYRKPRVDEETLGKYGSRGNLIAFSGHPGSRLFNVMFENGKAADLSESGCRELLLSDAKKRAVHEAFVLQNLFCKGNFFIEIQAIDQDNIPAAKVSIDILREVSKITDIPSVATPDAHYPAKEDALDQRILLCSGIGKTLKDIDALASKGDKVPLGAFFKSRNYYIPEQQEMDAIHTDEEVLNTQRIADMCEDYEIEKAPVLPKFPTPDGMTSEEYLMQLCRQGWETKKAAIKEVCARLGHTFKEYGNRVKTELEVLTGANLSDYFLIVHDVIQEAKKRGEFIGPGRGSAAGSLILYLLEISQVDPIEYGLLFERFYNAGRNTADRVSLPDIDMDFEKNCRMDSVRYCVDRYGKDNVAQMLTFSRLQGKSVLKKVMRIRDVCSFNEVNAMTKYVPQEAEISDKLKDMDQPSILRWTLENRAEEMSQWCTIEEDGTFSGKYAKFFEQAIRIEGTKKNSGKHPAGVVISTVPLSRVCPMVKDPKSKELIAGMEMNDLEALSLVKFDYLGNTALDKMHMMKNQLEHGYLGYDG
jgi:DNA polymerase-3 subunit alpha